MQLQPYLDRIQYQGEVIPTLNVLKAIHAAHVCSIPFENIDVQLGRRLTISINNAYRKIVEHQRGGWCYEQNGLFGWALSEIGFQVMRLAASVVRNPADDRTEGDHLCLLVTCPGDTQVQYLADVGFGGSMLQPLLLAERSYSSSPYELALRKLDNGYWQFREILNSKAFGFDFLPVDADEQVLTDMSDILQNDSNSNFVLNLTVQKRAIDQHTILRGRVLTHTSKDGVITETLDSADALVETLFDKFGIELPEVADLWPNIIARHRQLFA
ncbi:MAG: arylamine N-acetyltransferase [Granulosicoccus sp.]